VNAVLPGSPRERRDRSPGKPDGNTLYLHVVNTSLDHAAEMTPYLGGMTLKAVRAHRINPELDTTIDSTALDVFAVTTTLEPGAGQLHVPRLRSRPTRSSCSRHVAIAKGYSLLIPDRDLRGPER